MIVKINIEENFIFSLNYYLFKNISTLVLICPSSSGQVVKGVKIINAYEKVYSLKEAFTKRETNEKKTDTCVEQLLHYCKLQALEMFYLETHSEFFLFSYVMVSAAEANVRN